MLLGGWRARDSRCLQLLSAATMEEVEDLHVIAKEQPDKTGYAKLLLRDHCTSGSMLVSFIGNFCPRI
jgi:hypothetical protein